MTHPFLAALGVGYLLNESGLNVQDLFDEMFGLKPKTFDEPVAIEELGPPFGGEDPADIADPGTGAETEVMEEPGTGIDLPPEMEAVLDMPPETQVLMVGEVQERIIEEGGNGLIFQNGAEVEAIVREAVGSLTAADLRRRVRVSPEEVTETTIEPTVSSSAQEAGLGVQRGFIDGVEIGGELFQIP